MNIFFLSWIIQHCVEYHCDKHVVKMILETVQILSTAHHVTNPTLAKRWFDEGQIYKPFNPKHPCCLWMVDCRENYIWLCHFGISLCREYEYRYDKPHGHHKCYPILKFLSLNVPDLPSNNGVITLPRMAMPDQYKYADPVHAYRLYYLNEKQRMLVWRKRGPPSWVPPSSQLFHYQSELKRYTKLKQTLEKKRNINYELLNEYNGEIFNCRTYLNTLIKCDVCNGSKNDLIGLLVGFRVKYPGLRNVLRLIFRPLYHDDPYKCIGCNYLKI